MTETVYVYRYQVSTTKTTTDLNKVKDLIDRGADVWAVDLTDDNKVERVVA